MPKQRWAASSRSPSKKQTPRAAGRPAAPAVSERISQVRQAVNRAIGVAPAVSPAPPPPARKPAFYEALAIYEAAVLHLQGHAFDAAARNFRDVIQRYPDERELVERAQLYLRVCERGTVSRP